MEDVRCGGEGGTGVKLDSASDTEGRCCPLFCILSRSLALGVSE